MIFRGYIIENWFGTIQTNKYKTFNKIIVHNCIEFYISSQKNRNEIFYLKERQYEFLIKWYQKIKAHAEKLGGEALKFVAEYKIDERNLKD